MARDESRETRMAMVMLRVTGLATALALCAAFWVMVARALAGGG